MEFIINIDNYKEFVQKDKYLVIDTDFIKNNTLEACIKIIIKDIKDKDLILNILKVDLPKTKIEIGDCIFTAVSIAESTIDEVIFDSVNKNVHAVPLHIVTFSTEVKVIILHVRRDCLETHCQKQGLKQLKRCF